MASVYPGGLDSFATNKGNATHTANDHPTHHNDLADAINKIEAAIGTDPAGVFGSAVQRLGAMSVYTDLINGYMTLPRFSAAADFLAPASGDLALTYFTAGIDRTISTVKISVGSAAPRLTLARVGIYTVDGSGDGTLVGNVASDTTMFNSNYSQVSKSLAASVDITGGTRCAVAVLQVGTTPANIFGAWNNHAFQSGITPRLNAILPAQANLPASFTDASLSANNLAMWVALI